jgi:GTP:adenosylcobinamide-phosphate guanylyltransferase
VPAAVVLSGGGPDSRLAPGLPNKAFLEMGGRPLVARVLDALRACPAVDRIVAVGPQAALEAAAGAGVEVVPEQDSMVHNIEAALRRLPGADQVITVASDLPLLTGEVISEFLDRCPPGVDFCYPIVPQAAVEQRFPGARKTYVKVTDGMFTGGSVLLFGAGVIDRIRPLVEQMIAARKKPWLMAQVFGWTTVMKFASGRLSIAEAEARAREITGLRARAVIIERPELALDVDADRPENLALLQAAAASAGRR